VSYSDDAEGLRLECSETWLENLENQGNKLRIVSLRGRFLTLDLTKTKQGWHRADRNERRTVLQNICWDMQCCLVSWGVWWWTLYLMTGVCFAAGLGLISRKLCYVTRDETRSEFSVNVLMRQLTWHARHMSRPAHSINGSFVAMLALTAVNGDGHSQDGFIIISPTKEMWEVERNVLFNDAVSC